MEQYFYVVFNTKEAAFIGDFPGLLVFTRDILLAKQFDSPEEPEKYLKYFKDPENWTVKKVTVSVEL